MPHDEKPKAKSSKSMKSPPNDMDDSIRHIVEPSSEKSPLTDILEPSDRVAPLLPEVTRQPGEIPATINPDLGTMSVDFEVPPLVGWDDEQDRLVCPDPRFYYMLILVSGGDKKKMRQIVTSRKRMKKQILHDTDGTLRSALMARCIHEGLTRQSERDPLDWAKFAVDLMKATPASEKKRDEKSEQHFHVHAEGEQSKEVARQILDVAGKSDEAREEVEDEPEGD